MSEFDSNPAAAPGAEPSAAGSQYPGVMAEIQRLQNQKPGWANAVIILVVSVLAFVAIGSAQKNWQFYLWLIPLLLFHEGGHWIAMKIFGYRNLRMFFIPLFGAAVTGRNYNVPGWKKAVVSLAGPVPGILLGASLAVVAMITQQEWLNQAAFFLLIINGFNLLPVLPLDGGHVLRAILFCRNRWLDITFRVVAIVALILMGIAGAKFLLYLGIFMALGVPLAIKIAGVTDRLRTAALPPPLPGDDAISPATADAIIGALKTELPANTNDKVLALHTVNVYETLNAHPPSTLGTLGLLAVHGGSAAIVVVCGFLLVLNKQGGGLGGFVGAAAQQPEHPVECGPIDYWAGARAESVRTHQLIVATFPKRAKARREFFELTPRLPAEAELKRVGDSLLLRLPATNDAARQEWFGVLHQLAPETFVAPTNRGGAAFMCVAPSKAAATNLVQELEEYFLVAHFGRLIAPWSPQADGEDYAKARRARRAWNQIMTNRLDTTALVRLTLAEDRRGKTGEVERAQAAIYERLLRQGVASELVDLHRNLQALSLSNRVERTPIWNHLREKFGPEPGETNEAGMEREDLGASSGVVRHHGQLVQVMWVDFNDLAAGFPAMVDWFCDQQCRTLKYDFKRPTRDEVESER